MPRDMIDNEKSTAINPSETIEEKVSLSDRFGLWIGFHNISQETYLDIIEGYTDNLEINIKKSDLHSRALEWSITRGKIRKSCKQFILSLAGEFNQKLN